jgi:class 3 adenylate cyclase/CheY-like chemotaxis protein
LQLTDRPLGVIAPADRATVLVVDDTPDNLSLMSGLLRSDYKVKVASSGEKALQIAGADHPPDLVLLDIMMPRMDGYEVCRRLKADPKTRDIPVIFLTAKADVEDEQKGLDLRAADYITKPISPPLVLARVKTHLALKASADFLRDKNAYLEGEITRRVDELDKIQDIFGKVVDTRVRDYLLQKRRRMVGDITDGAVMFCDIRGFTAYSELRDPRQVIEFLNRFFSEAAAAVEREGGFINKYLGDAFMAVFGTPFPLADFRSAAIRAALGVREVVRTINANHPGEEPFGVGMGLHAGPMVAGIVGSASRMEFTIIGDTVNTARRMEGLCKDYGVEIIVSAALLAGTENASHARPLGPAAIRGKNQPVELFVL